MTKRDVRKIKARSERSPTFGRDIRPRPNAFFINFLLVFLN